MESTMQTRSNVGTKARTGGTVEARTSAEATNTGPSPAQQSAVTAPEPTSVVASSSRAVAVRRDGARDAYHILQFGFTVAPIVAGLDKFFYVLTNWDQYLSPLANRAAMGHGHEFMLAAGVIEVVAGIGIALKPRIFGYVVAGWLGAIILNLLSIPGYYDVALRDLGLALGALALARLAGDEERIRDEG